MSARTSGIVLAGGRSSRFGSDKLAATVEGVPLLVRVVAALASVCDEVLVVVPPDGRAGLPPGVIAVPDPEPFGGPLVGLAAGLAAASAPVALLAPGDMPWLEPAVLRLLLDELAATPAATAAALAAVGGPDALERFPLAVRSAPAAAAAGALLAAGERRVGALHEALVPLAIPAAVWLALDPGARSLRDIDRPTDLP